DGTIRYPRGRVMINTLFFVLGVSFTFFLLGFGVTALGRFFSGNRLWFARISGMIMILFGLYQFGLFGPSDTLARERRLPLRLDKWVMNPLTALILGFTFSIAGTPCVGPTLGSVLLMASSAGSSSTGFLLIGVYTLGFVIPFLAVGLFTGAVLGFFQRHQRVVRYTVKIGAALLILMGVMTLTGYMNGITSYLSTTGESQSAQSQENSSGEVPSTSSQESGGSASQSGDASDEVAVIPAPDFTLMDQNGETHTLSDYRGKTVFLNFWATWCGPCQNELPDIQKLYESYGSNEGDLVVLGVANPKTEDYPNNQDKTQAEVEQFLQESGYTFPVVMDTTGEVLSAYGISAFPTTFMIDAEGNLFGYVVSQLSKEMMESIVQQTMTGQRVS
ncbi:MAG: cytochrome c biogenesis protein/redoxin, partial [Lawsonibacter sp.]|nr:cytochrome c biogenesis protein/redoxin [Lawsonibacter sp.]